MDTIIAVVLMVMVGVMLLLGLIGLAICLGYVNVTTTWIVQDVEEVEDVEQDPVSQMHLQGERTRRAMESETRRYLDELYEEQLAAVEAEYQQPPNDGSVNVIKFQDFGSVRAKGRTS